MTKTEHRHSVERKKRAPTGAERYTKGKRKMMRCPRDNHQLVKKYLQGKREEFVLNAMAFGCRFKKSRIYMINTRYWFPHKFIFKDLQLLSQEGVIYFMSIR